MLIHFVHLKIDYDGNYCFVSYMTGDVDYDSNPLYCHYWWCCLIYLGNLDCFNNHLHSYFYFNNCCCYYRILPICPNSFTVYCYSITNNLSYSLCLAIAAAINCNLDCHILDYNSRITITTIVNSAVADIDRDMNVITCYYCNCYLCLNNHHCRYHHLGTNILISCFDTCCFHHPVDNLFNLFYLACGLTAVDLIYLHRV